MLVSAQKSWPVSYTHLDVYKRQLEDFAVIAGVELVRIDRTTTTESFGRELRWNQAYYRLAQGLAR